MGLSSWFLGTSPSRRGRRYLCQKNSRICGYCPASSEAIAPRTDRLTLLVADLVLGNAGIAARLPVDAMRLFGFSGPAAETGTHKLLSGAASHACCLRVAVLHTLLLGGELGTCWRRKRRCDSDRQDIPFHGLSLIGMGLFGYWGAFGTNG